MDDRLWALAGAVTTVLTGIAMLLGYMTNPPFIRASRVRDIREENRLLREHSERCERQVEDLRDENQWLLRRVRALEKRFGYDEGEDRRKPQ